MKKNLGQKGVIPVLVLISALGLLAFIFISSSANFKDKLFSQLFPKRSSFATVAPIVFKSSTGEALPTNSSGIPQTTSSTIKIELTSTLGPPVAVYTYPTPYGYPTPSYGTPSYGTPSYSYPTPYGTPSYGTPSSYETPSYGTPSVQGVSIASYSSPSYFTPASPSISAPITVGTVSYKIAENSTDLNSAIEVPYTAEPTIIDYTFQDSTLGSKFIWVEFKDSTGKTDQKSAQIDLVAQDTIAPKVGIGNPGNNTYVKGGNITFAASASDNVGIAKVEFYVDVALLTTVTTSPYKTTWNTLPLADGSLHTLTAKAYDTSNNYAKSSVSVTIDKTLPTVIITNPINGSIVAAGAVGIITITANASDSLSGIARVAFQVNGIVICRDTTSPYTCNWTVPTGSGISYTIKATASDKAGNTASNSIKVTSQ